jgi:hypothetical protein
VNETMAQKQACDFLLEEVERNSQPALAQSAQAVLKCVALTV